MKLFLTSYVLLGLLFIALFLYLSQAYSLDQEDANQKIAFVTFTSLPDLSLGMEPPLRHRSLLPMHHLYAFDGALRESLHESFAVWYREGEQR